MVRGRPLLIFGSVGYKLAIILMSLSSKPQKVEKITFSGNLTSSRDMSKKNHFGPLLTVLDFLGGFNFGNIGTESTNGEGNAPLESRATELV